MNIQEMFLTPNKYSRPQIPLESVKKIAVHYVGNPKSTAIANRNYFENQKNGGTYVSSHFVIGLDGEIIQCIPLNEWSYCTNQANGYSISIECCHPDDTGKFNEATENSLAELCAYLLKKYGLTADDIIRHYDVTGKQCPLYWSPTKYQSAEIANGRFEDFKNRVRALMKSDKPPDGTPAVPFLVRVLDPALNIREAPGTQSKKVGCITDGLIYTIVETAFVGDVEWGKLKSGAGWISLGNKYVIKL